MTPNSASDWTLLSRRRVQIVVWTSPHNVHPRKITICLNVKTCSHSSIVSYTSSLPAWFLYFWLMSPACSHHSGQKPHHPRLFSHSKCPLLLQCPISVPFSSFSWHHPPLPFLFSCYQSVISRPATFASLGSLWECRILGSTSDLLTVSQNQNLHFYNSYLRNL